MKTATLKDLVEYVGRVVLFKVGLDGDLVTYWVAATGFKEAVAAIDAVEPIDLGDTHEIAVEQALPFDFVEVTYPDDPPLYGFKSQPGQPGLVRATAASWAIAAETSDRSYERAPCVIACSEWP